MNIWQKIEQEITDKTACSFVIQNKRSVPGGDINQSFCISGGDVKYFVKINASHRLEMFETEISSLTALMQANCFIIPRVIVSGMFEQESYLVLEFLELASIGNESLFGHKLSQLHSVAASQFGFEQDNFIGRTVQINPWNANWGEFFTHNRLSHQFELLAENNLKLSSQSQVSDLLKILPDYLNEHNPRPALVHGDLWQGNYSYTAEGQPVLYDPAVYYADHEVDLAMLELFGAPGENFFESYCELLMIKKGYFLRKEIYNLYHILNHANLFGGGYLRQSEEQIKKILNRI